MSATSLEPLEHPVEQVGTDEQPDTTEHVAKIRVAEAEPDEEKRLLYEIPLECCTEQRMRGLVPFVVVARDDGVLRLTNVPVHLVEGRVTSRERRREIRLG